MKQQDQKLILAIAKGDIGAVIELLTQKADVNAVGSDGESALTLAVRNGHTEIVEALIDRGADMYKVHASYSSMTALGVAVIGRHTATVKALLARGANVNLAYAYSNNDTTLILAARGGDIATVEVLLAWGAHVNEVNGEGYTALMLATERGHTAVVKALLAGGAHVKVGGVNVLALAAQGGHIATVEALLAGGVDVNIANTNISQYTALISAAASGHTAMVEVLLARGAYVNAVTECGVTALSMAVCGNYIETVAVLIANNAFTQKIPHVPSVFDIAKRHDSDALTNLLQGGRRELQMTYLREQKIGEAVMENIHDALIKLIMDFDHDPVLEHLGKYSLNQLKASIRPPMLFLSPGNGLTRRIIVTTLEEKKGSYNESPPTLLPARDDIEGFSKSFKCCALM